MKRASDLKKNSEPATLVQRMVQRSNERRKKECNSENDYFTLKPFKYVDDAHPPGTHILVMNSDKFLTGKYLYEFNRAKKMRPEEYDQGIVIVSTEKRKSSQPMKYEMSWSQKQDEKKVICFGLNYFLKLMSERHQFHKALQEGAEQLIDEWIRRNDKTSAGNRFPCDRNLFSEDAFYKDTYGSYGLDYKSTFVFCITSYKFTSSIQKCKTFDPITMADLTLTIKLRNGLVTEHEDSPDLNFSKSGYTAPLVHFLNVLQSTQLTHFLTYVETTFKNGK